jgi:pectin methylesterase-like acyl-CoA thioesterase
MCTEMFYSNFQSRGKTWKNAYINGGSLVQFRGMGLLLKKIIQFAMITVLSTVISSNAVTKKAFDFVVGLNGDFKAAMSAATKASSSNRFVIFFPNGQYNIGSLTGDNNQMTTFPTAYVSFIGQSKDSVIIYNKSTTEGISVTATLNFKGANYLYMQDLTVQNKGTSGSSAYRHVVICEESNNVAYKNVKLLGTQDTYYTKGTKTYWEGGEIHGTVDFICGKGDVLFNKTLIWTDKVSSITAPDGSVGTYGYVFLDCTIDGTVSGYTLGRAWKQNAKCVYINTMMKKLPSNEGWSNPINTGITSVLLAEYNSKKADGSPVDLRNRKSSFTKDGSSTATCNPVLTASEAAKYTVDNIFGSWKPTGLTAQLAAPVASRSGSTLTWNDNADALCWVVFKDGKYFKCVTTPTVELASGSGVYTVRAANAMGGLGASSNAVSADGTPVLSKKTAGAGIFNIQHTSIGNVLSISIPSGNIGATLKIISGNGRVVFASCLDKTKSNINVGHIAAGSYVFEINRGNSTDAVYSQTVTIR